MKSLAACFEDGLCVCGECARTPIANPAAPNESAMNGRSFTHEFAVLHLFYTCVTPGLHR